MLKAQAASQGAVQMLRRRRRRPTSKSPPPTISTPATPSSRTTGLPVCAVVAPAMTEVDVVLETTSIVGSLVMVMVAEPFETWAP